MSADHQAAISEVSSYGKAAQRGVGKLFWAETEGPTGCGNRLWTKSTTALLLNVEQHGVQLEEALGKRLPARGAAGPGVLLLGAGRCVHRLLNGSIND